MNYAERLEKVAVLGAAGKMGSGIVLLVSLEMADLALRPENRSRGYVLYAVDVSDEALAGLVRYLRDQIRKSAEKRIVALRRAYEDRADLVENRDVVEQYVADALATVRPTTTLESAAGARIVFEAAPEDVELKLRLLGPIASDRPDGPWVFTNTSSIPIGELDQRGRLDGRAMGFHFYNPPAVQKLVELIPAATTRPEVAEFASALAKSLRKTVVMSNDIAGFIGNGHFMRDLLHAVGEAERLGATMPFVEAVYSINRVSQDFLVRPMGIFQLVDYVGLDVCQCILRVMDARLPGQSLHSALLDRLLEHGVRGGQRHDGSQKDGFFQYEQGRPVSAYDLESRSYVPFGAFQASADEWLGPLPEPVLPWKAAVKRSDKEAALAEFFAGIQALRTPGGELARRYGARSRAIGLQLVADGVAASAGDVNRVLLTGFFHAYGPINDYFPETVRA
jgi:3-hydroxyacyl-CoA dehydrogenase